MTKRNREQWKRVTKFAPDFAERLQAHVDAMDDFKSFLSTMGCELAANLYGPVGIMTLREAGRRTGLSPTYLSRVLNCTAVISPAAYLKLAALAPKRGLP